MEDTASSVTLSELIARGGIYRNVSGEYKHGLFLNIINQLPDFSYLNRETLFNELIKREELMSTGIGNGIALPHPRMPLLKEGGAPFVAIAFPDQPLYWNAPDGNKVHTIFLIICRSSKEHLSVLSRINFLCKDEKIYPLLKAQAPADEIIAAIRKAEAEWT